MPIDIVQEILGYTDIKSTMRYAHIGEQSAAGAADAIANISQAGSESAEAPAHIRERKMKSKRGPWTLLSQRVTYDNRWIQVTHHEVRTPKGESGIYGTIHFKNWAIGIVPVDDQGFTYLVGQHRFPLDNYSWEIPEGGGSIGVDVAQSAARELKEETGLTAEHWQKLAECELSNSVSDERAIAFLAWGLSAGQPEPDATEDLAVRRLPLSEAFAMVENNTIRDALSVLALQAVRLLHVSNRLPVPCA